MTDKIVTRHCGRSTWQGPESEALSPCGEHRLRLSWHRDHEGVVSIYGTDENTGKVGNFADLWLDHLVRSLGWRREYAKQVQTELADMIVETWNAKHGDREPSHD